MILDGIYKLANMSSKWLSKTWHELRRGGGGILNNGETVDPVRFVFMSSLRNVARPSQRCVATSSFIADPAC